MSIQDFASLQLQLLSHALDQVSSDQLQQLADLMCCTWDSAGQVFLTGVGKNALLAASISSSLRSLGTRSHVLDAQAALHGDLGVVQSADLLVLLSRSGATAELLQLLQALDHRCCTVLIHSTPHCAALQLVRHQLLVPVEQEADVLNIMPSASISVYTVLLQALVCELAQRRQLTAQQFLQNHPGGSIGQQLRSQR